MWLWISLSKQRCRHALCCMYIGSFSISTDKRQKYEITVSRMNNKVLLSAVMLTCQVTWTHTNNTPKAIHYPLIDEKWFRAPPHEAQPGSCRVIIDYISMAWRWHVTFNYPCRSSVSRTSYDYDEFQSSQTFMTYNWRTLKSCYMLALTCQYANISLKRQNLQRL